MINAASPLSPAGGLIARNYPQVNASTKRIMFGPPEISAIEVRIKAQTRCAARAGESIAISSPRTRRPTACVMTGRTGSKVIRLQYSPALGRELVDKQDIDNALGDEFLRESRRVIIVKADLLPAIVRRRKQNVRMPTI